LSVGISPQVVILSGVAGSGKTTVGRALAERLGWPFHDADDLHSPASVERMRNNLPLDDEQRQPWLLRVRAVVEAAIVDGAGAVIACSALKERYRHTLADGLTGVRFVFLTGDPRLLRDRLEKREGHFAGAALLDSQLAVVEPPRDALTLDVVHPVAVLVDRIIADLRG
jgi:gluconokinase